VPLAQDFRDALEALPPDWSHIEFDLRIFDEDRYIEATTLLVQVNAEPYSTVEGTLALLDAERIRGELAMREVRTGRVEVVQMWGRPESVRQEFRRRRAQ
jgi:hypothetical protein